LLTSRKRKLRRDQTNPQCKNTSCTAAKVLGAMSGVIFLRV